jgi:hypothetical protein
MEVPDRSAFAGSSRAFGNWNTVSKASTAGPRMVLGRKVLEHVQTLGDLDRVAPIGSTMVRVDTTMRAATLEQIRVPRPGRGRLRTRPDRVLADKARLPGIKATIPEKPDQAANRMRKGSFAGWQPAFDSEAYKSRNVTERRSNRFETGTAASP